MVARSPAEIEGPSVVTGLDLRLTPDSPAEQRLAVMLEDIINRYQTDGYSARVPPSQFVSQQLFNTEFSSLLTTPSFREALKFVDDEYDDVKGEELQCVGWVALLTKSGLAGLHDFNITGREGDAKDMIPRGIFQGDKTADAGDRFKAMRVDAFDEFQRGDVFFLNIKTAEGHTGVILDVVDTSSGRALLISEANKDHDGLVRTYWVLEKDVEQTLASYGKIVVFRPYTDAELADLGITTGGSATNQPVDVMHPHRQALPVPLGIGGVVAFLWQRLRAAWKRKQPSDKKQGWEGLSRLAVRVGFVATITTSLLSALPSLPSPAARVKVRDQESEALTPETELLRAAADRLTLPPGEGIGGGGEQVSDDDRMGQIIKRRQWPGVLAATNADEFFTLTYGGSPNEEGLTNREVIEQLLGRSIVSGEEKQKIFSLMQQEKAERVVKTMQELFASALSEFEAKQLETTRARLSDALKYNQEFAQFFQRYKESQTPAPPWANTIAADASRNELDVVTLWNAINYYQIAFGSS